MNMNIDDIIDRYLESDKSVEEFLEIESIELGDIPEKSPKPTKEKEEEEDEKNSV